MAKERLSRSDSGVNALVRAFMEECMGLTPKTISLMMKRIVDSGEFAAMKSHVRGLSGSTHKRINQAIDMAEEDNTKNQKAPTKSEADEDASEMDADKASGDKKEKKDVKEGTMTFMNHLLNEVNVRAIVQDELDATGGKDERMKRARMGDVQLKRKRSEELKQQQISKDPIDRKILQLQQQIATLRTKKKMQSDQENT